MALQLPNGAICSIAGTYAAAKTITALSNAAPPVASSVAHGYTNGDLIEITSGWSALNGRIVRVAGVTTDSFTLEGIDASAVARFPAGSGIGTARKITAWTTLQQVLNFESTGGDQNYWQYQFLEDETQKEIPTFKSPQGINLEIGDDPTLAGYAGLVAANDDGLNRALRVILKDGKILLWNVSIAVNKNPKLSVNTGISVSASLRLQNDVVRYAA